MGARVAAQSQQIHTTAGARCLWPDSVLAETKNGSGGLTSHTTPTNDRKSDSLPESGVTNAELRCAVTTLRRPLGRIGPLSEMAHPSAVTFTTTAATAAAPAVTHSHPPLRFHPN